MVSALAEGSNSGRTSRGMMALRAGWLIPAAPLCRAMSPYRIQMLSNPSQACAAMPIVLTQSTAAEASATFRRS